MVHWLVLLSCSSAPAPEKAAKPPTELDLSDSWPARFATVDSWTAYQSPGWLALVGESDIRKAVETASPGPEAARAHTEAAGLFRMAALVSAHCLVETYDTRGRDTDPLETLHLLAVSHAMLGHLDTAREYAGRLPAEHVVTPWHAPWRIWLGGEATWPPDLGTLPVPLPEPAQGTWPELSTEPSFSMPVGDLEQPMGDPGALLLLAWWHEAAAATTGSPEELRIALDRFRLPAEADAPSEVPLSMDFLYASDFLDPDDAAFLASLRGEPEPDWEERSLLARITANARSEGQGVTAERGVDLGRAVRAQLLERAKAENGGNMERHHRMFADIAEVGVLRSLAEVAESEGNREESGKLRLAAYDIDFDHTRSLPATMSLAAWQASNGYPYRAQEVVQRYATRYPSLEIARYSVDVLALRVSLEDVQPGGQ